jgi:hypothetical protein
MQGRYASNISAHFTMSRRVETKQKDVFKG